MTHPKYGVKGKGKDEGDEIEKDFIGDRKNATLCSFFAMFDKKSVRRVP